MPEKIAVIGAGQAGSETCAALRAGGYAGEIALVGEEAAPPYQRPPLSKKYLLGEMEEERLYLRPRKFYAENAIQLVLGAQAVRIDRAARLVRLADGGSLVYDRLVLATGARPRTLPRTIGGELGGVYAVRGLADVDAMAPEFAEGRRVLIVGGGYIGLEAAAVARQRGLETVLIEAAPRILGRVAGEETAGFIRELHRAHGVDLREGVGLDRLEGEDGRVRRAILSDGAVLEIDFAIVGVGVEPNTGLAEAAGLAIENGIATDAFTRSSDPAIHAAGDCASLPYKGGRIRLESVQNAIDQAKAVADAILGTGREYRPFPWFWSDQYDLSLQIAGLNTGYDQVVSRPGAKEGAASFWYFRDGAFLAVDAMNDARAYMVGKRLLETGGALSPAEAGDAGTDLKQLLRRN